jgi:hypothetical protein
VNNPEDLTSILIQLAIVTFCYFILMPVSAFLPLFLSINRIFFFFPGYLIIKSHFVLFSVRCWILFMRFSYNFHGNYTAAYHLELALEKNVQEKAFGDVFAIHVRLHFLSRVSCIFYFKLVYCKFISPRIMFIRHMELFSPMCRILLWAPFLNFRKFPRDPSLQYPWSKPEDPSKIKNDYLRYPWATPEDYD